MDNYFINNNFYKELHLAWFRVRFYSFLICMQWQRKPLKLIYFHINIMICRQLQGNPLQIIHFHTNSLSLVISEFNFPWLRFWMLHLGVIRGIKPKRPIFFQYISSLFISTFAAMTIISKTSKNELHIWSNSTNNNSTFYARKIKNSRERLMYNTLTKYPYLEVNNQR